MDARATLKAYLQMKVEEEDWHGVADAAMDLRDHDAYRRGLDDRAKENAPNAPTRRV